MRSKLRLRAGRARLPRRARPSAGHDPWQDVQPVALRVVLLGERLAGFEPDEGEIESLGRCFIASVGRPSNRRVTVSCIGHEHCLASSLHPITGPQKQTPLTNERGLNHGANDWAHVKQVL